MTKRKNVALITAAILLVSVLMFSITGCNYKSGDEVGKYFVDIDGKEYNITLSNGGNVEFKVADKNTTGSYSIKKGAIKFELDDKTKLTGTYENGTIKLTYNGVEMVFSRAIDYTVKFDSMGGSAVSPVSVRTGRLLPVQVNPTRTQYEFIGWYTDKALKNEFNFAVDKITSDITLYAKWSYINIVNTITYANDEKTSTVNSTKSVVEGQDFVLEVPTIDNNFKFDGWYADGKKLTDANGNSLKPWNPELGNVEVTPHYVINLAYEYLEDGTVKVSGSEALKDSEALVIPANYDGKVVTVIGNFPGYTSLKTVNIPATVTLISDSAFIESKVLQEHVIDPIEGVNSTYTTKEGVIYANDGATLVRYPIAKEGTEFVIPASVTAIADRAFYGILSADGEDAAGTLTKVTFPANLQTIGDYAFQKRGPLSTLVFADDSTTKLTIGKYAFNEVYCQDVILPSNLVSIGEGAFMARQGSAPGQRASFGISAGTVQQPSRNFELPQGLETIGDYAFANARSCATSVTFPASLKSIGEGAFKDVWTIKTIEYAEGITITEIPAQCFERNNLSTLVLPKSVTTIGERAYAINKFNQVEIPEGITTIGNQALAECTSLKNLTFPASIVNMGDGIFAGCSALNPANIIYSGENNFTKLGDDGVLYNKDMTEIVLYPSTLTNTEYVVPATVEIIPNSCFIKNKYLTKVVLPEGLKIIGNAAFKNAGKLTEVNIPSTVTSIGSEAFMFTNIESIEIPANVTSIGNGAFKQTRTLTTVTFAPNSKLTSIGAEAFNTTGITSIVIPEGVESLGDKALQECESLESITIPSTLKTMGVEMFRVNSGTGCLKEIIVSENNNFFTVDSGILYNKNKTVLLKVPNLIELTELTLLDSVVEIGPYAFQAVANIKTVNLNNVKVICKYAFEDTKLTTMDLSKVEELQEGSLQGIQITSADISNVKKMGISVFGQCTALAEIIWSPSLTEIPDNTFTNAGFVEFTIPKYITSIGEGAFGFNRQLTSIAIPEGITEIKKATFKNCSALESVVFPSTITIIGDNAFENTKLASIEIPKTVTSIGSGAFTNCASLKSVVIPEGITEIKKETFKNCTVLENVVLPSTLIIIGDNAFNGTKLVSIEIPKTVTSIGSGAFTNCASLKSIVIPEGITEIKASTFMGCVALENIQLPNTLEVIGANAFKDCIKLSSITLPKSLKRIEANAFLCYKASPALVTINIPENVEFIASNAFFFKHFRDPNLNKYAVLDSFTVDANNKFFMAKDGCLYKIDGTTLVAKPANFVEVTQ